MFPDPKALPQNAEAAVAIKLTPRPGQVVEPKLDGIRILAHIDSDGNVKTYTRTGKAQTGKLPAIEKELAKTFKGIKDTWLDGEVVGFREDGSQDWGAAQSCLGSGVAKAAAGSAKMVYVVFDCLALNGFDTRSMALKDRRQVLASNFIDEGGTIVRLVAQEPYTEEAHLRNVEAGYEGSMVKDETMRYASGVRGGGWYKLKATDEADVIIMGFKPGENGFKGMIGAIEFGQYKVCETCKDIPRGQTWLCPACHGDLQVLAHRGKASGMDMATRKHMTEYAAQYIGCVISVAYMGIMPSGALRHPQYKRLRDDKPSEECVWTR